MMQHPPREDRRPKLSGRGAATAAEAALGRLRDRILTGDLAPGTKLNQADLARELGMSRIPVRDAIRALAGEGLVTHDPHRTAVVTPLSVDDLAELYEIRIALEPHTSALALDRVTDEVVASMGRHLDAMSSAQDSAAWLEAHDRFHASLYRHSGRPRMIALLDRARAQTRRYTWIRLDRDAEEIAAEHRLIFAAAQRGDPASLRTMVEAHLTTSHESVTRQIGSGEVGETRTAGRGGETRRATA